MDDTTSNVALQVHSTEQSSQVQVFVRMVPLQKDARRENFELERRVIRLEEPGGQRVSDFVFDGVFPENAAQNHVYQKVAAPLVDNLMQGINSCCLAYGQTGSGKTYSIFGVNGSADKDERRGIVSTFHFVLGLFQIQVLPFERMIPFMHYVKVHIYIALISLICDAL